MTALKCPMCQQPVRFGQAECGCGEVLTFWWKMVGFGRTARQQGLKLAAAGEFFGACLAFLEDALANPMERQSLVDAARALVRLNRVDEAMRLLKLAGESEPQAAAVLQAIEALTKVQPAPEEAGEAAAPTEKTPASAKGAPAAPFMGLAALERTTKKAILGKAKREVSDGWKWALALEQHVAAGIDGLDDALASWQKNKIDPALRHYVEGLRQWRQGKAGPAREAFQACLMAQPPVLNPAVYFLYLHLALQTLPTGWQQLHEWTTAEERQQCRTQLEAIVAQWDNVPGVDAIRELPAN